VVGRPQVLAQQGGRPHRRVVPKLTRIPVNDLVDEGIDNPLRGGRPAAPRRIQETRCRPKPVTAFKTTDPVIDRASRNTQFLPNLCGGFAIIQQEQSQCTLELPRSDGLHQQAL
jgi:hypothetical protein